MKKKCPDCLTLASLQPDYPASFWEAVLSSLRILKVTRCGNCNAAVFVLLGSIPTTRKRLKALSDKVYWYLFTFLLLVVGYVLYEAIIN